MLKKCFLKIVLISTLLLGAAHGYETDYEYFLIKGEEGDKQFAKSLYFYDNPDARTCLMIGENRLYWFDVGAKEPFLVQNISGESQYLTNDFGRSLNVTTALGYTKDRLYVAAVGDSLGGEKKSGAVSCFFTTKTEELMSEVLTNEDLKEGAQFGYSLGLYNLDYLIVGAPGANGKEGAVYLYKGNRSSYPVFKWELVDKLQGSTNFQSLGCSLDINMIKQTVKIGYKSKDGVLIYDSYSFDGEFKLISKNIENLTNIYEKSVAFEYVDDDSNFFYTNRTVQAAYVKNNNGTFLYATPQGTATPIDFGEAAVARKILPSTENKDVALVATYTPSATAWGQSSTASLYTDYCNDWGSPNGWGGLMYYSDMGKETYEFGFPRLGGTIAKDATVYAYSSVYPASVEFDGRFVSFFTRKIDCDVDEDAEDYILLFKDEILEAHLKAVNSMKKSLKSLDPESDEFEQLYTQLELLGADISYLTSLD